MLDPRRWSSAEVVGEAEEVPIPAVDTYLWCHNEAALLAAVSKETGICILEGMEEVPPRTHLRLPNFNLSFRELLQP